MMKRAYIQSSEGHGGENSGVMVNDQSSLSSYGGGIIPVEQDTQRMEHDSLSHCGGGAGRGVLVKRTGKFVFATWILVLAIIVLEASMVIFGISIGINPTESQPYRIFLILKNSPFKRGDLISFRFPGSKYYAEGSLFVKEVRGMPGDRLNIRKDRTVWLNGKYLDTVRAIDSRGRSVEPFRFDGLIPDGYYFLYAPVPNSYDSRYYGLIGKERMVGKAIPLW